MSYKTIALDAKVYERLSRQKHAHESFTKTIDRLVQTSTAANNTCGGAVETAATIWRTPPTSAELAILEGVVADNRKQADWNKDPWL